MTTATKERPDRIASTVKSGGGSSPGAKKTGASGDDSAAKRKGKSLKVKIGALLVLLLVGGAIAKFTVLASPAKPAGKVAPAKGPVVPIDEMTLNLADGHYLRLKIVLQTAKGTSEELDTSEAAQALIDTYSNQTVAQLTGDAARAQAKQKLLGKLNALYPKKILDAYYTEFVMTT
jgi:flagellar protein FliL